MSLRIILLATAWIPLAGCSGSPAVHELPEDWQQAPALIAVATVNRPDRGSDVQAAPRSDGLPPPALCRAYWGDRSWSDDECQVHMPGVHNSTYASKEWLVHAVWAGGRTEYEPRIIVAYDEDGAVVAQWLGMSDHNYAPDMMRPA